MKETWNQTGIGARLGEALITLLGRHTIDQISVKDICHEAHINRSTFYNYFDDKYQLRDAVMEASIEVFIETFQERVDEIRKRAKSLRPEQYLISDEILDYYLELVREYREVFLCFAMSQGTFYSEEHYQSLVETIVLPVLKQHGIDDKQQAEYMTVFYLGAIHSVVLAWLRNDCADSVDYIANIIRTCLHIPKEYFGK